MKLHTLRPAKGATKKEKRLGFHEKLETKWLREKL
jgi:hypothetical protein